MTLEAEGSATAVPDAGTPEVATSTGAEGGSPGAATADPFAGLDTGTREWIGKKGYKGVEDVAKAALNAETLIGRSVVVPGDDAKPEDFDKFYGRIGRPEKPDGYEFKLPEGLPEDFTYSEDFASAAKAKFHEVGLSSKQAAALHDWWVSQSADGLTTSKEAMAAAQAERMTKATEALEGLWGAADSDKFKANLALADRAVKNLGNDDLVAEMQAAGLLGPNSEIMSPRLADAFAKVGAALFKEDSLEGGTSAAVNNPFADASANVTEQMRAYRTDPDRARRLIAAAGKKPSDFGLPD